jgi:hypothetical protein
MEEAVWLPVEFRAPRRSAFAPAVRAEGFSEQQNRRERRLADSFFQNHG